MADVDELAREAYAAYGAATGGQDHRGEPLPTWDDLPAETRSACRATIAYITERIRPYDCP
ncbi:MULTISPECIES: hypothetical protein [Actinomadura]|uniref:Uncharacterized protein n=1 Tax=Actinomadura yumaensis TaxID=111807 RepID=A0ABW2CXD7_9ACTN|nr:hypothetical protein [Actinomadura sp. J1-007]MWK39559.1 hypothetical protein [Actinomadura sp. J1-007]